MPVPVLGADAATRRQAERRALRSDARWRRLAQQQDALAELGREALVGPELNDLFGLAARVVAQALELPHCAVFDTRTQPSEWVVRALTGGGPPAEVPPLGAPGLGALEAKALASQEPVLVQGEAAGGASLRVGRHLFGAGVAAGLAVPLTTAQGTFGVLCAYTPEAREFAPEETSFLLGAAALLGAAVQRADGEAAQRLAAERLQEIGRLEEVTRFRGQVLHTVSHELKNPLAAARLEVWLLREGKRGPIGEPQAAALASVARSVERMSGVVQDLLDAARLERGKLVVRPVPLDLPGLVRESVEALAPVAAQVGVALGCEAPGSWQVEADGARIGQVMANLLGNALKFTPPGGRVMVGVSLEGSEAVVRVRDTGLGFTGAQRAQLFQPFSQVHDIAELPQVGGTGLGLFLARGLVEQHGGRIWCDSPGPGAGSTFAFALPLRSPPEAAETVEGLGARASSGAPA